MTTKKTCCLVVVLLVTTITNLYSMDRPREENVSELVGKVLLGTENPRTLSLVDLPKDILHQIVQFVSLYSTAESLEIAANNVNSLSSVSKSLHTKLNDPIFCLQLIKDLAKKFDCTDYDACKALKIPAAKQRLEIQQKLYALCRNVEPLDFEGNPVSPRNYINLVEDTVYLKHYTPPSELKDIVDSLSERKYIFDNLNKRQTDMQSFSNQGYDLAGCRALPVTYDFEKDLNILRQQNVDFEFTYPFFGPEQIQTLFSQKNAPMQRAQPMERAQNLVTNKAPYKNGLTPLMISLTQTLQLQPFSTIYLQPQPSNISKEKLPNHKKIPILLISHGANINGTNNNGDTALMLVTLEGQFEKLKFLCENTKQSIAINKQNNEGYTALMYIFLYGTTTTYSHRSRYESQLDILEIINYLVLAGADLNITDNKGETFLDHAKKTEIYAAIAQAQLFENALKGSFTKELLIKALEEQERRKRELLQGPLFQMHQGPPMQPGLPMVQQGPPMHQGQGFPPAIAADRPGFGDHHGQVIMQQPYERPDIIRADRPGFPFADRPGFPFQ